MWIEDWAIVRISTKLGSFNYEIILYLSPIDSGCISIEGMIDPYIQTYELL